MAEQSQATLGGPGTAGHPELEDLAALADGRCQAVEAKRLRAHLATCEECREVFLDTLGLLEAVPVLPFPSSEKRTAPWWLAAAALLVLGAGLPLWRILGTAPAVSVESLSAQVARKVAGLGTVAWNDTLRGEGGDKKAQVDEESFQTGVAVVNLQVALDSNDLEAADSAAAQVCTVLGISREGDRPDGRLISSRGSLLDPEVVNFYGGLRPRLKNGELKPVAHEAARRAEALGNDDAFFDLGAWTEAGRLAAIARVPSFFHTKQANALLGRLRKEAKEGADLPDEVVKALETIDGTQTKTELSAQDYSRLKDAFEQILGHYYPVSHSFG